MNALLEPGIIDELSPPRRTLRLNHRARDLLAEAGCAGCLRNPCALDRRRFLGTRACLVPNEVATTSSVTAY